MIRTTLLGLFAWVACLVGLGMVLRLNWELFMLGWRALG